MGEAAAQMLLCMAGSAGANQSQLLPVSALAAVTAADAAACCCCCCWPLLLLLLLLLFPC